MSDIFDVLIVSFDSSLGDVSGLCVARMCGEKPTVLKMEIGKQANILYRLLTEQSAKAEIMTDKEGTNDGTN